MKAMTKTQMAAAGGGVDIEAVALSLAHKALDGARSQEYYGQGLVVERLLRALADRFGYEVEVSRR